MNENIMRSHNQWPAFFLIVENYCLLKIQLNRLSFMTNTSVRMGHSEFMALFFECRMIS